MPKRTTLTYTSEDAPNIEAGELFAYHCSFSGRHVLTIDCNLKKLPRRRTDGSYIVDTNLHKMKMYTTPGSTVLIKRHSGKVERQYRCNIGKLPVAYRTEEHGQLVYILSDAVASYDNQGNNAQVRVPPCITRAESGATEVRIELEEKQQRTLIAKVTADVVRIHITNALAHEGSNEEILEMLARVLGSRLSQIQITKGGSSRNRVVLVDHLSPEQVFQKLQHHLKKRAEKAEERGKL